MWALRKEIGASKMACFAFHLLSSKIAMILVYSFGGAQKQLLRAFMEGKTAFAHYSSSLLSIINVLGAM